MVSEENISIRLGRYCNSILELNGFSRKLGGLTEAPDLAALQ